MELAMLSRYSGMFMYAQDVDGRFNRIAQMILDSDKII
jgi:hypothetical protein